MKTLPLAVLAALALPATAVAKEVVKVTACGTNGCQSSNDGKVIAAILGTGNSTGGAPKAAGPGYKVRAIVNEGDRRIATFANWHVPSLRLIRAEDGTWMEMTAAGAAALRRLARNLRPFAARRIPLVAPAPRGALPPQTYNVAERPTVPQTASDGGGLAWWPFVVLAALIGFAALFIRKLRKETHTWESSTTRSRSSPGRPAA